MAGWKEKEAGQVAPEIRWSGSSVKGWSVYAFYATKLTGKYGLIDVSFRKGSSNEVIPPVCDCLSIINDPKSGYELKGSIENTYYQFKYDFQNLMQIKPTRGKVFFSEDKKLHKLD